MVFIPLTLCVCLDVHIFGTLANVCCHASKALWEKHSIDIYYMYAYNFITFYRIYIPSHILDTHKILWVSWTKQSSSTSVGLPIFWPQSHARTRSHLPVYPSTLPSLIQSSASAIITGHHCDCLYIFAVHLLPYDRRILFSGYFLACHTYAFSQLKLHKRECYTRTYIHTHRTHTLVSVLHE